jgi:hypothetical protein
LLGAGSKKHRLLDNALGGFIESIPVTIRASDGALGDNRLATFADFEILWRGNDLLGAGGSVGQVGITGHAGNHYQLFSEGAKSNCKS